MRRWRLSPCTLLFALFLFLIQNSAVRATLQEQQQQQQPSTTDKKHIPLPKQIEPYKSPRIQRFPPASQKRSRSPKDLAAVVVPRGYNDGGYNHFLNFGGGWNLYYSSIYASMLPVQPAAYALQTLYSGIVRDGM